MSNTSHVTIYYMDGSTHTERNVKHTVYGVDPNNGMFLVEPKLAYIDLVKVKHTENVPHVFKTKTTIEHRVSLEHVAALEVREHGSILTLPLNGRASVKTTVKLRQKQ